MKCSNETTWKQSVISGGIAGMSSVVFCHPFDTIRTRLQAGIPPSSGLIDCVKSTFRFEGFRGFYKGFIPPLFSQGLYKAVIFTVSTEVKEKLSSYLHPLPLTMVSGAIAGGVNSFIVTPVELVRNRLQIDYKSRKNSTLHCISSILRQEGFLSLWKGLCCTIYRDSLGVACYFAGFTCCRNYLISKEMESNRTTLISGAVGGVSFWLIALPFDTIKTIVQIDKNFIYNNFYSSTNRIITKYGVLHLFKGWQVAFSRGIPSAAITFWVYTKAMEQFKT